MMLFSAAAIAEEPVPFEFRTNDVILFQQECSPAYHMVRAFLDYYDIPYKTVEFKSLKKEIKSLVTYKVLMVDGELIADSQDRRDEIDKLIKKIHYDFAVGSETECNEEKKWRRWVDKHLIKIQFINTYRSFSEALESFEYYNNQGTFNFIDRIAVKYVGAGAAYFLLKIMKKKYKVTDERVVLYKALEAWVMH